MNTKDMALPLMGRRIFEEGNQHVIRYTGVFGMLDIIIKCTAVALVIWVVFILVAGFNNYVGHVDWFMISDLFKLIIPVILLQQIYVFRNSFHSFNQQLTFDHDRRVLFDAKGGMLGDSGYLERSYSDFEYLKISREEHTGHESTAEGGSFISHHLELLDHDGAAITLMNHAKTEAVNTDAATLARYIGVTLIDSEGQTVRNLDAFIQKTSTTHNKSAVSTRGDFSSHYRDQKDLKIPSFVRYLMIVIFLAAGYSAVINFTASNPVHPANQIPAEYLDMAITQDYDQRWASRNISMNEITKMVVVPIDEQHFDVHAAYIFNNVDYETTGMDRRKFRLRLNEGGDSISVVSMGSNQSANFAWAYFRYYLSRLF